MDLFGRKKMYKKGMSDALKANADFQKKQQEALEHIRKEFDGNLQKMSKAILDLDDNVFGIIDHLNSKEKAALYKLCTPMDIKELEKEEKYLLVAVLFQLASDEGDILNDFQRNFIRSIQQYLEISNPQTNLEDVSVVGDINSLDAQKAFLRVALEFIYLQDDDEFTNSQVDFLSYFSVNKKQSELIESDVARFFNILGAEGLSQKYGYVSEEIEETNIAIDEENEFDNHNNDSQPKLKTDNSKITENDNNQEEETSKENKSITTSTKSDVTPLANILGLAARASVSVTECFLKNMQ